MKPMCKWDKVNKESPTMDPSNTAHTHHDVEIGRPTKSVECSLDQNCQRRCSSNISTAVLTLTLRLKGSNEGESPIIAS